jgi:hypothetical protein
MRDNDGEPLDEGTTADIVVRMLMQWERAWEGTFAIVDLDRESMAWAASRQMLGETQRIREMLARGEIDEAGCTALLCAAQALLFSGLVQASGGEKMRRALAERLAPLADRGRKELEAGQRAADATHGPLEVRRAKYADWQSVVDEIAAKRPEIPFRRRNGDGDDVLTLAARRLDIPRGTLKDHVRNPKRPP